MSPRPPVEPFDRFEVGPVTTGWRGYVRELYGYIGADRYKVGEVHNEEAGVQLVAIFDAQMKRFPRAG